MSDSYRFGERKVMRLWNLTKYELDTQFGRKLNPGESLNIEVNEITPVLSRFLELGYLTTTDPSPKKEEKVEKIEEKPKAAKKRGRPKKVQ